MRVKELAGENSLEQEAQINDSNSEGILLKKAGSSPPPQINVKINIDKTVKGNLMLYDRDKIVRFTEQEIAQNDFVWNIPLEKRFAPPYILYSDNPAFSDLLDLSNADVGKIHEFSFPQSKK